VTGAQVSEVQPPPEQLAVQSPSVVRQLWVQPPPSQVKVQLALPVHDWAHPPPSQEPVHVESPSQLWLHPVSGHSKVQLSSLEQSQLPSEQTPWHPIAARPMTSTHAKHIRTRMKTPLLLPWSESSTMLDDHPRRVNLPVTSRATVP
jgi:hypothetical protein